MFLEELERKRNYWHMYFLIPLDEGMDDYEKDGDSYILK